MLLPAHVLGAQVKGARVLQVGRQHDGLVTGLTRQLHSHVPCVERDKGKVKTGSQQMFVSKGVEARDGVAERAGGDDVVDSEGGERSF